MDNVHTPAMRVHHGDKCDLIFRILLKYGNPFYDISSSECALHTARGNSPVVSNTVEKSYTIWPKVSGYLTTTAYVLDKHPIPKSWALKVSWSHLFCYNSFHCSM